MTYQGWIANWLATNSPYGQCESATAAMAAAYPELRRVRGHVDTMWGRRAHWWLITPDGEIIDPTAGQFQGVACSYVPWTPDEEVRLGKCMNCGAEIWGVVDTLDSQPRMSACDERCEAELAAWIDGSQQAQEEMFGFDEFDMFNEEEIL